MPTIEAKKLIFGNPTTVERVGSVGEMMSELSYVWAHVQTSDGVIIPLRCQIIGGQLHLKADRYPQEIQAAEARLLDESDGQVQDRPTWIAVMLSHIAPGIDTLRSDSVALGDELCVSQLGADDRRTSDMIGLGVVNKLTLC